MRGCLFSLIHNFVESRYSNDSVGNVIQGFIFSEKNNVTFGRADQYAGFVLVRFTRFEYVISNNTQVLVSRFPSVPWRFI